MENTRQNICLNGEWDFMPVYGIEQSLELPEKLAFETVKIRVPSSWRCRDGKFGVVDDFRPFDMFEYPDEWNEAYTGVYRRFFKVPEEMRGKSIFLKFDGILQMSRIYINGKAVADWDEGYLPLTVDITDAVKKNGEENELHVVCTSFNTTVINSGKVKSLGLVGSWLGKIGRGIWQDVFLESRPQIAVQDVHIITSVRKQEITAGIELNNKYDKEVKLKLTAYILNKNDHVKDFPTEEMIISPGNIEVVDIKLDWQDPVLWSPENPHLYLLVVNLSEDGKTVDEVTHRFGFREVWTEGENFMLNGIKMIMRGDAWHFRGTVQQTKEYALNWYRVCRENGISYIRLHAEPHPEYYLDAADEAGMLIIDETAMHGSGKSMAADHPVYIERCKKHVQRLVKRDRNHPSVIVWSLENEMRWVDGRDEYKLHIPALMQLMRDHDGTRPIILDGDNRLIPKENVEIDSLHYNIDGTIAQWERKHPLIIGEHGGWWYLCPQNTSAYAGLGVYQDMDRCLEGMALKEKLFVEYARRKGVTGVSPFNLAHYMMRSIPEKDVRYEYDRLDTPGCKPKVLRKYSLTINNGTVPDCEICVPNPSLGILRDSLRKVTVIPSEYNHSFFDDKEICRSFDIYNDTMKAEDCRVDIRIKSKQGDWIMEKSFTFTQEPFELKKISISFIPPKIADTENLELESVLFHGNTEMFRLSREYKLYSSTSKELQLAPNNKEVSYFGSEKSWEIIYTLIPSSSRLKDLEEIVTRGVDILIVGSYTDTDAYPYAAILQDFLQGGGVIVILEQSKFIPGEFMLFKKPFFSAHMSNESHPVLKGLEDKDLIFWGPDAGEDAPLTNIAEQCYVKPVEGELNMILECSMGDFGDGGDLWTPLFEYSVDNGSVIINQLELTENFYDVPQACILLRNILDYAMTLENVPKVNAALLTGNGQGVQDFAVSLGLDFQTVNDQSDLHECGVIIADPDTLGTYGEKLNQYVEAGGKLFLLPVSSKHSGALEKLLKCNVSFEQRDTYQLKPCSGSDVIKGISLCDLFRIEKVNYSPRLVENIPVCTDAVYVEDATVLLESVEGLPWVDYFVRKEIAENSRNALMKINQEHKKDPAPYLLEKKIGRGSVYISQISCDMSNEKNVRLYSRILANLGCPINTGIFLCKRGDSDYAVDYFMALPHEKYNDYKKAEEHYSDKLYSLNNLGEGLYGWMKKLEKKPDSGFIHVPDSSGQIFFLTCFPEYINDRCKDIPMPETAECILQIDSNCSFKLWLNGICLWEHQKKDNDIERIEIPGAFLEKGINRLVIAAAANREDIQFRPVFMDKAGKYFDNVRYKLTIDEVDPK